MGSNFPTGERLQFADFEVDLASRELRKHGVRVHLHDQPFQVLAILAARPRELVTREELRQELWKDGTFVDFENGLNSAVNRLREALCDSAKLPKYIETVPRRGYRFIAPISHEPPKNEASDSDTPTIEPQAGAALFASRSNWRRGFVLIAGVFALLTLVPMAAWRPFQRSAASPLISLQLRPVPLVTFANGSQWLPAFSPDGSRIAYSWQTETGWYLEVKDVGTDRHLRLTPHPASFPPGPTWSPDGRQIAYARAAAADDRGIFVVSAIGGPEKKLRPLAPWHVPQRVVNWSPDGRWIAFADEARTQSGAPPSGRGPNAIYLISPETLETRQLTFPPHGDFGDSAPTFSPDGLTIAFVRTKADSHDEIYRIALTGGSPRQLIAEGLWTNGLAWTSDGASLIFDRSLAGGFRLWRVSSIGSAPHPLDIPSTRENFLEPSLWRDRLAYESHETIETVGRIALNGSRSELPATPVASTRLERGGRYSPDGERIAFISNRTGGDELWTSNSDGTNPVQLTHLRTLLDDISWGPNGESIAVSAVSGKVFLVSLETQNLRLVFDGLPFVDEQVPNIAFSRNGNFLYVLSQPGTGDNYELLKVPISGGTPAKVMEGKLSNFVESMDGKTLFYSRAGGIWKHPLNGGAEQFVAPASGLWDLRSDSLYLLTNSSSIERYSLDGKRLQTIAKLGHFGVKFPMSISPDTRWALFGYEQRQTVEIDMVQGFN